MNRFGQEVILTVTDEAGAEILDARGLRVDFDIRQIRGFNRASVSVYNLTDKTIGSLVGAKDTYLTLSVRLHNGPVTTLMDKYYISNSIDEKKLPNTITTLYCYDALKKRVLENYVDVVVVNPTLQDMVDQVLQAGAAENATPPNTRYQSFPVDLKDYVPMRPITNLKGSVQACMKTLELAYSFNMYTEVEGILMVYKPHGKQVPLTDLDEQPLLQLDTNNMRANPKLAPAQLQVSSNLDPRIKPGAVLDISQLLTAGVNQDEVTLQLADQFAAESLAGYSRYQTLTVQHKGSNYTGDWTTTATAVSPTDGINMPTVTWFR